MATRRGTGARETQARLFVGAASKGAAHRDVFRVQLQGQELVVLSSSDSGDGRGHEFERLKTERPRRTKAQGRLQLRRVEVDIVKTEVARRRRRAATGADNFFPLKSRFTSDQMLKYMFVLERLIKCPLNQGQTRRL